MKIINLFLVAILALLSLGAGAAKLMQVPQEIEMLQQIGLAAHHILFFGLWQIVGGALVTMRRTRLIGCGLIGVIMSITTVMILISGDIQLALFSLLTIVLVGFVAYQDIRAKKLALNNS